jgi:predicted DCC family thiol-disulfide oxidoreductase YuxK
MPTVLETEPHARTDGAQGGRALVLYDGQCPLCLKSVENLQRFDWFHVLQFQDARDGPSLPQREPPLDLDRLLMEMHLITPDNQHVYHGFEAFRWIAWRLPLLLVFAPLLYLPGVPALGEKIYLWIARNRFRLVPCHHGICHVPPQS